MLEDIAYLKEKEICLLAGGTNQSQTGVDFAGDLKEEQGMEVRLTPSIEQVNPPQISFNFEEIKEELAANYRFTSRW